MANETTNIVSHYPELLSAYPWNLAICLLYVLLFVSCNVLLALNRNEYVIKVRFFPMLIASNFGGLILVLSTTILLPEDDTLLRRFSFALGISGYFLFLIPYLVRAIRLKFLHEFSTRHLDHLPSANSDASSVFSQSVFGNAAFMEWIQNLSRERHSQTHLAKWALISWAICSVVTIIPMQIFGNFNIGSDPAIKAFTQRFVLMALTGIAVVVLAAAALVVRKSTDKFSIQREIIVTAIGWILNFGVNLACNLKLGNDALLASPVINTFFLIIAVLYSTFWPVLTVILARAQMRRNSSLGSFHSSTTGGSNANTNKDSDAASSLDSLGGESGISAMSAGGTLSTKPGKRDREELKMILSDKKAIQEFEKFAAEEFSVENVLFYRIVESYHNKPSEQLALEIFDKYVRPGSPYQVNVDERIVKGIKSILYPVAGRTITDMLREKGEPLGSIYNNAQREVFEIMRRDTFSRFVLSKAYEDLSIRKRTASEARRNKQHLSSSPPIAAGFFSLLIPPSYHTRTPDNATPRRGSRIVSNQSGEDEPVPMTLGSEPHLPPVPRVPGESVDFMSADSIVHRSHDILVENQAAAVPPPLP